MNLPRTNTAYPICEKCGGNIGLLAFPPKCACRAQPAAPAEQEISAEEKFCDGHCSWAEHHPDCSLAAPPAQPVAHLWQHGETGRTRIVMPDQIFTADANWLLVGPMYLHPAAAPAEQSRGLLTCAGCGSPDWPLHEDGCPIRHAEVNRVWNSPMTGFRGGRTPAAAPSVVPEPLFLLHSGQIDSGGEQDDWETEADSQVRVDEFCRLHPGQTIPLFAHPPRAPSVAPEPVAWTLQSELDAAQTTCSAHLWFTNPRNSAWTALFTREQIAAHPPRAPSVAPEPPRSAQLMICTGCGRQSDDEPIKTTALACCPDNRYRTLRELLSEIDTLRRTHPPRAPLTEEQKRDLVKECDLDWQRGFMPLFDGDPTNRYAVLIEAVEAAHGIGGK